MVVLTTIIIHLLLIFIYFGCLFLCYYFITNKEIQFLLDPNNSLTNKLSLGSPSIKEVNRMLKIRSVLLKGQSKNLDERINNIFSVNDKLTKIIRSIIE